MFQLLNVMWRFQWLTAPVPLFSGAEESLVKNFVRSRSFCRGEGAGTVGGAGVLTNRVSSMTLFVTGNVCMIGGQEYRDTQELHDCNALR
jgi:hypothetical protein